MSDTDKLIVRWSKRDKAHLYCGGKQTGGMLAHYFEGIRYPDEHTLMQELERRGYDLTTLRFSIKKKVGIEHEDLFSHKFG